MNGRLIAQKEADEWLERTFAGGTPWKRRGKKRVGRGSCCWSTCSTLG